MKRRISYLKQPDGFADITIPPAMLSEFRTMVQRATSTWQDMSPDMRDFADRVLGRDHVMGSNMKEGFQEYAGVSVKSIETTFENMSSVFPPIPNLATRSCCGTMLREPHLASCAELAKLHYINNTTIKPCVVVDPAYLPYTVIVNNNIPEDEVHAVQDGKLVAKIVNLCNGHPETCNCPKHCK